MKKILASVFLSTSLLFSTSTFASSSFGLGVSPTYTEMEVSPGKTYRKKIIVANMGTSKPLSIVVGSASWTLDKNGELQLFAPTQETLDPNNWIRFTPSSFTLEPQKNIEILVDINVPIEAPKKEFNFAILSSTVLPSKEIMKKSKNIWEKVQVGSLFYVSTSTSLNSNTQISLSKKDNKSPLLVTFDNTGDKHSRINGTLSFYEGSEKIYSQESNLVLMPNQNRTLEIKLPTQVNLKGKKIKIVSDFSDTMNKDNKVILPKEAEYDF